MKQVYVKTPGYLIHLHGYGSARTPVRFNVKEKHIPAISKQLNTQGIQFELMEYDENAITISAKPHEKDVKEKDSPVIGSDIDMLALAKVIRLIVSEVIATHPAIKSINDKLEKLIDKKSIASDRYETEYEAKEVKRKAKKRIEVEEEFIPSIKIDEMTIQSKGIFRVEQSDTDANKAAELLTKVTK